MADPTYGVVDSVMPLQSSESVTREVQHAVLSFYCLHCLSLTGMLCWHIVPAILTR